MDLTKDTSNSNLVKTLERRKIRNEAGSPTSAIRRISRGLNDEERSLSKEELKEVAQQLKVTLTEFYQKLRLLKSFSFTNLSAFANIMKKYDKITLRHAARSYMKIVDKSYLGSSNEVTELMNSTENLFAKHFNGKRIEGMKPSRQGRRRERNGVTFFSGLFSGCSIALVVAIILMVRATRFMEKGQRTSNMDNMFGLYSLFLFIVLHMLMYAGDLYFWERYQVNYRFIFNFKKRTALGYHELFLLSTGLAVLALASFLANLNMVFGSKMEVPKNFSKSMPLIVASVFLAIVFLPFNIIYHTSRFSLIKRLFRCICAPFYKVTLADFFFADQLTSQIQALRSIEFYICYYSHKGIPQGQSNCHDYKIYNIFYSVLPIVPYWFISLQCLRRLVQEKDHIHGYNALKYLVAVIAIIIRTVYELRQGTLWLVLALISSALAVAYNAYWDIVVDWGLLHLKSNKLFLRDKRLVSHRSVYFVAMVINVLLRVAWLQLVLAFDIHGFRKTAISILIYCLEIIRRGIWNFFRLENEHLNNVGKFRAFTSVPLTSNHHDRSNDDDDDDDDDDDVDDETVD
ncbi:phosphate transporter PHO1 homolog 10-like isoform X2 [Amaranthus tricolor]|nr:phosphate transporter PHO1 homolog 10-like isoform X2 [Amaranthus tricolor]